MPGISRDFIDPAGQLTTWDSQVEITYRQLYIQTDKQTDRQTDIERKNGKQINIMKKDRRRDRNQILNKTEK